MIKPRPCDDCQGMLGPYGGLILTPPGAQRPTLLCVRCYLAMVHRESDPDRDGPEFRPATIYDSEGVGHDFEFETFFAEQRTIVKAREVRDGRAAGYEFSTGGDADADPSALFLILYERLRRELRQKYLTESPAGPQIGRQGMVRGTIEWDSEREGDVPLLIIDGQPISWDEMGRMLMTWEGFAFKLEVFDLSEET